MPHRDAFWTPPQLLFPLLEKVTFPEPIWEPAAGAGWIAEVLVRLGYEVIASDTHDYGYPPATLHDFYDPPDFCFRSILTNPPFRRDVDSGRGARDWVRRACSYRPEKLALLMSSGPGFGDCGVRQVIGDMGLKTIIRLTEQAEFTTAPGTGFNPPFPTAWFVFERGHTGSAEVFPA